MKYQYLYFNTSYSSNGVIDRNDYNAICLRDCENVDDIHIIPAPLYYSSRFIRRLFNLTNIIDKKLGSTISHIWFPFIFREKLKKGKPVCIVVSSYHLPLAYFCYLKRKYPDCRLVKIYRDLTNVISNVNSSYSPDKVRTVFDILMTFDKAEAQKFNMLYFDEIESKIEVPISDNYPLSDVFFAARAKDRLPKIISAYDRLTAAGLKCDFYITGVSEEDRVHRDGIVYADVNLPYLEMLYRSVNSRCMLDINQSGAIGYTSRFIEAVLYNKKIIVDNPFILESKYYNPLYIQHVSDFSKIDTSFINNGVIPQYEYDGDFSPLQLIEKIEKYFEEQ